jgi:hydroxymethylbilane synthase
MTDHLTIGTRGSELALWQSHWVADRLRRTNPGLDIDLEIIKTSGDKFQEASLAAVGGKGAFTKEIQDALRAGRVDVAVHSLKDLPTQPVPGLRVWAHPERFDPRDAWVARDGARFFELPDDAIVATGALRRRAQLLHRYPFAQVQELRGNVGTRLRKLDQGEMHGIFLAQAGLERLGLLHRVTELLEPETFLPAPGQGALAIEGRDDRRTGEILAPLDHANTRACVTAERALLATLEGGCQVPIGALARLDGDLLRLDGLVVDPDGSTLVRGDEAGPADEAAAIGARLAERLLSAGGGEILERLRTAHP